MAMKRKLALILERIPRRALLATSLFSVLLVGIAVGNILIQNNTTIHKPGELFTINIQDPQFHINSVLIIWQTNSVALNMTNTGGGTATDQVLLTFYNGTSRTPLANGGMIYTLTYTPTNETAIAYLDTIPFQLTDLSANSRITIQA